MRRRTLALLAAAVVLVAAVPVATFELAAKPIGDDRYTILVMGSDMGPWRSRTVLNGRSDAIHLVSVVPSQNAASILSWPRDSYVPVPGMGSTRINAALTRGPETSVRTVEDLTGIEIDDWMVTGMLAFTRGVTNFGGLPVDVPQNLNVDDLVVRAGDGQTLDGADALVYARDRKSRSDGDFGRNRAQAQLLAIMHKQLVARDPSARELLGLVRVLRRNTVSSVSPARTAMLAKVALDIDPAKVVRKQVPGRNGNRGGASVVVLGGGAEALYADMRDDGLLTP